MYFSVQSQIRLNPYDNKIPTNANKPRIEHTP